MINPLVTTSWLQEHLGDSNLVLLDASMAKVVGKKAIEYDELTLIPSSQKLDLESVLCDLNSSQTHAFPSVEQFSQEVQRLGIKSDTTVVIYDNQGVYSAPRAWWIFQAMGFTNVFVLNGGLPKWVAENRETTSKYAVEPTEQGNISGRFQINLVCDSRYIVERLQRDLLTVFDARSSERFSGSAPEPRPGVRRGHIPDAISLPFTEVLSGDCFKTEEQLAAIFATFVKDGRQLIFSCGSGITACIILLASIIAGHSSATLYDGSWADWGSNELLPIVAPS